MDSKSLSLEYFDKKYSELLRQGFSNNSPEMLNFFKLRNEYLYKMSKERYSSPAKKSSNGLNLLNSAENNPHTSHIIVDPHKGYFLLNSNLELVDEIKIKKGVNFFDKKLCAKRFKKQLGKDFRIYKKENKRIKKFQYRSVHNAYKKIKLFLVLCPDADYRILTLLQRNITKTNPDYKNYFCACAEYLDELASDYPDKSILAFDINYSCNPHFDDLVMKNHYKLGNIFCQSKTPVTTFRNIVTNSLKFKKFYAQNNIPVYPSKTSCIKSIKFESDKNKFLDELHFDTSKYNAKSSKVKAVPRNINYERC